MSCNIGNIDNVNVFSSDSIVWQGEDIACLGIETGVTLTTLETAIANKVCELVTDIDLTDVTLTGAVLTQLGSSDKTIANLIQALNDDNKTLRDLLESLGIVVNAGSGSLALDFKCIDTALDPCDATVFTLQNILQIIINAFCDLKDELDNTLTSISTTVTQTVLDTVEDMITTCQDNRVVSQGSGLSKTLKFRGFVPPLCAIPYFGSLSYFDGDGKGLPDSPFCDWQICNGKFGTPDLRGRVIPGAVQGVPGGSLHSDVDPALAKNSIVPSANYAVGDSGGEIAHLLTSSESGLPSHTHTTQPHTHGGGFRIDAGISSPGSILLDNDEPDVQGSYVNTQPTTVLVNANNPVNATARHENRMPYKAGVYIMMIS